MLVVTLAAWVFSATSSGMVCRQADELEAQLKKLVPRLASDSPDERVAARADLGRLVARDRSGRRFLARRGALDMKECLTREGAASGSRGK